MASGERITLDEYYIEAKLRAEQDPRLQADRRRWDAEAAADIAGQVECKACHAPAGQLCEGLTTAVHVERQQTYIARGLPGRRVAA